MIQMRTILQVADNSGARKISCILPVRGSTGRYARLGDVITASVKESAPDAPEPVRKGKVVKAVIVRSRKEQRRRDGSYIRFDGEPGKGSTFTFTLPVPGESGVTETLEPEAEPMRSGGAPSGWHGHVRLT